MIKERPEKDRRRRRQEAAEAELRVVRRSYTDAFSSIDGSLSMLRRGVALLAAAHASATRGEVGRHRLAVRLAGLRSARRIAAVTERLRVRVTAARGVEVELPEDSEEALSRFVEKLSSAMEILQSALEDASLVRKPGLRVPRQISALMQEAASAESFLRRISISGKSLLSSEVAAVTDAVDSPGAFD